MLCSKCPHRVDASTEATPELDVGRVYPWAWLGQDVGRVYPWAWLGQVVGRVHPWARLGRVGAGWIRKFSVLGG